MDDEDPHFRRASRQQVRPKQKPVLRRPRRHQDAEQEHDKESEDHAKPKSLEQPDSEPAPNRSDLSRRKDGQLPVSSLHSRLAPEEKDEEGFEPIMRRSSATVGNKMQRPSRVMTRPGAPAASRPQLRSRHAQQDATDDSDQLGDRLKPDSKTLPPATSGNTPLQSASQIGEAIPSARSDSSSTSKAVIDDDSDDFNKPFIRRSSAAVDKMERPRLKSRPRMQPRSRAASGRGDDTDQLTGVHRSNEDASAESLQQSSPGHGAESESSSRHRDADSVSSQLQQETAMEIDNPGPPSASEPAHVLEERVPSTSSSSTEKEGRGGEETGPPKPVARRVPVVASRRARPSPDGPAAGEDSRSVQAGQVGPSTLRDTESTKPEETRKELESVTESTLSLTAPESHRIEEEEGRSTTSRLEEEATTSLVDLPTSGDNSLTHRSKLGGQTESEGCRLPTTIESENSSPGSSKALEMDQSNVLFGLKQENYSEAAIHPQDTQQIDRHEEKPLVTPRGVTSELSAIENVVSIVEFATVGETSNVADSVQILPTATDNGEENPIVTLGGVSQVAEDISPQLPILSENGNESMDLELQKEVLLLQREVQMVEQEVSLVEQEVVVEQEVEKEVQKQEVMQPVLQDSVQALTVDYTSGSLPSSDRKHESNTPLEEFPPAKKQLPSLPDEQEQQLQQETDVGGVSSSSSSTSPAIRPSASPRRQRLPDPLQDVKTENTESVTLLSKPVAMDTGISQQVDIIETEAVSMETENQETESEIRERVHLSVYKSLTGKVTDNSAESFIPQPADIYTDVATSEDTVQSLPRLQPAATHGVVEPTPVVGREGGRGEDSKNDSSEMIIRRSSRTVSVMDRSRLPHSRRVQQQQKQASTHDSQVGVVSMETDRPQEGKRTSELTSGEVSLSNEPRVGSFGDEMTQRTSEVPATQGSENVPNTNDAPVLESPGIVIRRSSRTVSVLDQDKMPKRYRKARQQQNEDFSSNNGRNATLESEGLSQHKEAVASLPPTGASEVVSKATEMEGANTTTAATTTATKSASSSDHLEEEMELSRPVPLTRTLSPLPTAEEPVDITSFNLTAEDFLRTSRDKTPPSPGKKSLFSRIISRSKSPSPQRSKSPSPRQTVAPTTVSSEKYGKPPSSDPTVIANSTKVSETNVVSDDVRQQQHHVVSDVGNEQEQMVIRRGTRVTASERNMAKMRRSARRGTGTETEDSTRNASPGDKTSAPTAKSQPPDPKDSSAEAVSKPGVVSQQMPSEEKERAQPQSRSAATTEEEQRGGTKGVDDSAPPFPPTDLPPMRLLRSARVDSIQGRPRLSGSIRHHRKQPGGGAEEVAKETSQEDKVAADTSPHMSRPFVRNSSSALTDKAKTAPSENPTTTTTATTTAEETQPATSMREAKTGQMMKRQGERIKSLSSSPSDASPETIGRRRTAVVRRKTTSRGSSSNSSSTGQQRRTLRSQLSSSDEEREHEKEREREAREGDEEEVEDAFRSVQFITAANVKIDVNYKVILIGNCGVGKTCFLMRLHSNNFTNNYTATLGLDFKTLLYKQRDRTMSFKMWDTAGQERFQSITRNYYSGAHLIIIFFDLTYHQSFVDIRQWVSSIKDAMLDPPPLLLLGNKKDLKNKCAVDSKTAQNVADVFGATYMTVSAKTGETVADSFMMMMKLVVGAEEKGLYQNRTAVVPQGAVSVAKTTKVVKSSSSSSGCCGS